MSMILDGTVAVPVVLWTPGGFVVAPCLCTSEFVTISSQLRDMSNLCGSGTTEVTSGVNCGRADQLSRDKVSTSCDRESTVTVSQHCSTVSLHSCKQHVTTIIIIIIIIIIITDLYSAFRSEDTEALDAAQED